MIAPLKSPIKGSTRTNQRIWPDEPSCYQPAHAYSLLGKQLVEQGIITSPQLLVALALQARQNVPLGEILVAQGFAAKDDVLRILAKQNDTYLVDLAISPPDPQLCLLFAPEDCLRLGFIPWRTQDDKVVLATAHPERISGIRVKLPPSFETAQFVLAAQGDIQNAIHAQYGAQLAVQAEHRTAIQDSCRNWSTSIMRLVMGMFAVLSLIGALVAPTWLIWVLFGIATFALVLNSLLKVACTLIALRPITNQSQAGAAPPQANRPTTQNFNPRPPFSRTRYCRCIG